MKTGKTYFTVASGDDLTRLDHATAEQGAGRSALRSTAQRRHASSSSHSRWNSPSSWPPSCGFALLAGFIDAVVGGGGLIQIPRCSC